MSELFITKYEDAENCLKGNKINCKKNSVRPEVLVFKDITFEDRVQINEIAPHKRMNNEEDFSLVFDNCIFKNGLEIKLEDKKDFKFKKLSLKFNEDNTQLDSGFSGDLVLNFFSTKKLEIKNYNFNKVEIKNLDFEENSKVLFENIKIDEFIIERVSQDSKYIQFHNIEVIKKLILERIEFKNTYFNDFNIESAKLKLDKVSFIDAHLNTVKWGLISKIEAKKDIFRQLKYVNDQNGNYIDGNKFYVQEMQVHRKELQKDKNRFLDRITLLLNKELSNYGQSWLIALFWMIIISYGLLLIYKWPFGLLLEPVLVCYIIISILIILYRIKYKAKNSLPQISLYLFLMVGVLYIYHLANLQFQEIFQLLIPKPEQDYKVTWAIHKVLIAFPLYHFTISIRRITRR